MCLLSQVHQPPDQNLRQINLLHPDVENAVQSTWPMFINRMKIDANEHVQGQISDLHVQIDELKDTLCDVQEVLSQC